MTPMDDAWDMLEKKLCPEGKAAAKRKFKVYPSAYANGWAAKMYKKAGGGWKTVNEFTVKSFKDIVEGKYDDIPEGAFYMVGGIEEVIEKANKMKKEAV